MDLETYHHELRSLQRQLTSVMDQLDEQDPAAESDHYDLLTNKMIALQDQLRALDARYNQERKQ